MEEILPKPLDTSLLPLKRDIVLHYEHLKTQGFTRSKALRATTLLVLDIWTRADCPPIDYKLVSNKITELLNDYQHRDEEARDKSKRPRSPSVPSRKSSRLSAKESGQSSAPVEEQIEQAHLVPEAQPEAEVEDEEQHDLQEKDRTIPQIPFDPPTRSTRTNPQIPKPVKVKAQWFQTVGTELFDILSSHKCKTLTFDSNFYNDQKGKRSLKIKKDINPEFMEEMNALQKKTANVETRKNLAYGIQVHDVETNEPNAETEIHDSFEDESLDQYMVQSDVTPTEVADRVVTRSSSCLSSKSPMYSTRTVSTQTESLTLDEVEFAQISTRVSSKKTGSAGKLIHPKILEAIVKCETLARNSTPSAIEVCQIVANTVFNQKWELPLALDRDHLMDLKFLKQSKSSLETESNDDLEIQSEAEALVDHSNDDIPQSWPVESSTSGEQPRQSIQTGASSSSFQEQSSPLDHATSNEPTTTSTSSSYLLAGVSTSLTSQEESSQSQQTNASLFKEQSSLLDQAASNQPPPTSATSPSLPTNTSFSAPQPHQDPTPIQPAVPLLHPSATLPSNLTERIESSKVLEVTKRVEEKKANMEFRLPSMTAVRDARYLMSLQSEKKIAEEMLTSECAIIPDGTSRKVIGKVGGAMLQVGGKICALPFQQLGNDTRQNWAKFIEMVIQRMSTLADKDKQVLWSVVLLFISDKHITNRGLAAEAAKQMGFQHQPGQIFCTIHPILMMDEKVKGFWQELQIKIGHEKIFPSITYSNIDQNTFIVILQSLDALMRLVSPTHSHKAWS